MKKEKYIRISKNASGNKIIRIEIRAYDQVYRKTLNMKDYSDEKEALKIAKRIRDKKLVEMSAGYTVNNNDTVYDIYQKTFDLLPVRQKTVQRHGYYYKLAIQPYGSMPIDKVTSADIQKSINEYAKTHKRMQTGGVLAVWRRIYKTAAMMNINIPDRTQSVIIPECIPDNPRKIEISAEDLEIFLETLQGYNAATRDGRYQSQCIYYAVQVMRYCGLRPAETFALTREDICITSEKSGYITINKASHSTINSRLEIGAAKTKKSNRRVPMPSDLVPIMRECLSWAKYEFIFADIHGNLQDIDTVGVYVHNVAKKAKVQFNLYMLRHQFSTDLIRSGVNPAVIRDLMGHESARMTLDYAVSYEDDRRQAVDSRVFS